jgi:hypothetical protein
VTDAQPDARPARPARVVPLATLALLSALVLLVAPAGHAAASHGARDSDGDDPVAVDLIHRSAEAPGVVSYAGTQYVSAWSSLDPTAASASAVMTLEHTAGGDTRIGVPNQQASLLEWRESTSWLAGGGGSADLLLNAYEVAVAGTGAVAGRPAVIVEARRDDGTVAARLWLDTETALTLRRETFDEGGALLNASAFVEIEITVGDWRSGSGGDDRAEPMTTATSSATIAASALDWSDINELRDSGWHCPDTIAGDLKLYEAHRYDDVVHLSYSDGVMTVSVFEQPGRLDHDAVEGYRTVKTDGGVVYAAPGPPARYMWSSGDRVLTVVSEAPASVLGDLTALLPPDAEQHADKPDDGFLARIARGAKKVGSFLNPFD